MLMSIEVTTYEELPVLGRVAMQAPERLKAPTMGWGDGAPGRYPLITYHQHSEYCFKTDGTGSDPKNLL